MTAVDPGAPAGAPTHQLSLRDLAVLGIAVLAAYFVANVAIHVVWILSYASTQGSDLWTGLVVQALFLAVGVLLFRARWRLADRWFGRGDAAVVAASDLVDAQAALFAALGVWFAFATGEDVARLVLPFLFEDATKAIDRLGVIRGVVWIVVSVLLVTKGRALARLWNDRMRTRS